jgi:cyclopropane fatty-acyl-phospholipid synthase-like methyltransferase
MIFRKLQTIHPDDTMYDDKSSYFRIGQLALKICLNYVDEKLLRQGNILDFPSGYGRVLRHFAAKFPKAKIFACELDSRMLEFTEGVFGAIPIQANEECLISIEEKMDLIFTGSLLTHFDDWQWDNYFRTIEDALF